MKKGVPFEEAKRREREREAAAKAERQRQREEREAKAKANGSARLRSHIKSEWLDDIIAAPDQEQDWLINGLLPMVGLALLYGPKKTHKSFIALDIAFAIILGTVWADRECRPGTVVYVAGEGGRGLRKRMRANFEALSEPRPEGLRLLLIEARFNLGTADRRDYDELLATIRERVGNDGGPVLIVFDTLSRMLGPGDENGDGMRSFVDHAERLATEFNCLVLAIHHVGWEGKHPRGGSMLGGAAVASWRVTKWPTSSGLGSDVLIEDAKDSVSGEVLKVTLRAIDIGDHSTLIVQGVERGTAPADDDGIEVPPERRRAKGMVASLRAFMTALDQAADKHGCHIRPFNDGPQVWAVKKEDVRRSYDTVRARDDLNDHTLRSKFNEHFRSAVDREVIITRQIDGVQWIWKATR